MTDTIFRVPSSAYAMAYFHKYSTIPIVVTVIILASTFIAGFNDMRWWLLGLMMIFTVIPMAISMAWFITTGRRDMALKLRPQSVSADNGTLTVKFYPFEYDRENPVAMQTVVIKSTQISDIIQGSPYMRICLGDNADFDFLLIPAEAMPPSILFEK